MSSLNIHNEEVEEDDFNLQELLQEGEKYEKEIENEPTEAFTPESLSNLLKQLQINVKINQELRLKYSDQPDKFMDSELDLDEDVICL